MVRLIARGPDEPAVRRYFEELAGRLRESAPAEVKLLGPAPAPILKIRNLYRYHLRLLCPMARPLQALLRDIPPRVPVPTGVELAIDIDPMSLL
jgi:primosomal protein N' (replication factor Y)